jgi:hypothetical protein
MRTLLLSTDSDSPQSTDPEPGFQIRKPTPSLPSHPGAPDNPSEKHGPRCVFVALPGSCGFRGWSQNSLSASLDTVHQILHRTLRISHHRQTGRFDKPVMTIPRPSNSLVHGITGRLRYTGEKDLY